MTPCVAVDVAEEVRAALSRVQQSSKFARTKRSRELLGYLVNEVLAERHHLIKEHTIAQDLWARDQNFDPRIDTHVRTEAWRLRRRLADYYARDGQDETLRIVFPPRSLVPMFMRSARTQEQRPRRILLEFEGHDDPALMDELREDVARSLVQLPGVVVQLGLRGPTAPDYRLRCVLSGGATGRRIATRLTEESSGEVKAAEAFSRNLSPPKVATGVVQMTSNALAARTSKLSVDLLDASERGKYLDSLLRGTFEDRQQRLSDLRAAIGLYNMRVEQDPEDLASHRRLVASLGLFLTMAPTAAVGIFPRLAAVAASALAQDDRLSDVWLTLGLASSYAYDWQGAERAYRQALIADPLDAAPYVLLTLSYLQIGKVELALEAAQAAAPLDPISPLVASAYGMALTHARRFTEAADVATRALDSDPDFPRLRLLLGDTWLNQGKLDSAIEQLEWACLALDSDPTVVGLLGLAYGRAGERGRALKILDDLRQSPDLRPQSSCAAAMIHLGFDDSDAAVDALADALRVKGTPGLFMCSALFDPVRIHPRYGQLQRALGIATSSGTSAPSAYR